MLIDLLQLHAVPQHCNINVPQIQVQAETNLSNM